MILKNNKFLINYTIFLILFKYKFLIFFSRNVNLIPHYNFYKNLCLKNFLKNFLNFIAFYKTNLNLIFMKHKSLDSLFVITKTIKFRLKKTFFLTKNFSFFLENNYNNNTVKLKLINIKIFYINFFLKFSCLVKFFNNFYYLLRFVEFHKKNIKPEYPKNRNFDLLRYFKNLIYIDDHFSFLQKNLNFFSNIYLNSSVTVLDNYCVFNSTKPKKNNDKNLFIYNNHYPLNFLNKNLSPSFDKKFKLNNNIDYILYTNKAVITFLEVFLNKKIFIKTTNNNFNKIKNYYFNNFINDFRNYQPAYFKNFLLSDFIEILWYSFMLKDLKMLSDWVSVFMESLNFKNHKKFVMFFNNLINKYSGLFIDVLGIKGFFFDIRGKVGVTGSSKKRHFYSKFGSIGRSKKNSKIDINQNLVRTYSGVMGLTYIINY